MLCVESVDLPDNGDVNTLRVDASVAPVESNGVVSVGARRVRISEGRWPYPPDPLQDEEVPVTIALTSYHDWANRGPSTMRVWIPTA